jgi:hypothetical protein
MVKKTKSVDTTLLVTAPTIVLKKPRKKATKNLTVDPQLAGPPILSETSRQSEPRFVEEMTVPVKVYDVVIVKVKKIKCQGKEYYFDSMSGKVYAVLETGVGPYKGRYDPEKELLNTSYPDSDAD